MFALSNESYVCDPRPDYPLFITAKRYWAPEISSYGPEALTLILAHGIGCHKEQWEPTVEHLHELLATGQRDIQIRDVWSIDCPNHGDAAVLNEATLQWGYRSFDWGEYARAIHIFLAGLGKGVDTDFSTRNLVGIGHSMGAVGLILSNTFWPKVSFKYFILAEPVCLPPKLEFGQYLIKSAQKRRDIFASREEAFAWLKSRAGFKSWDERVLKAYVDFGMRDLPSLGYSDMTEGVTLKCTKGQELACYIDPNNNGCVRSFRYLATLCSAYPVHILYAPSNNLMPDHIKDRVLTHGTLGKHASVRRVSNCDHLMVQTQPLGLAEAICAILNGEPAPWWDKSKL